MSLRGSLLGQAPIIDPNAPITQGPQPGMLWLESRQEWVDAKSWNQEPIYDTEQLVTPVAAGVDIVFYRNLAFPNGVRKDLRYTNMVVTSQMPSGWYASVYMMCVQVLQTETGVGTGQFTTPEDVQRILMEGVMEFETGNQKTEKEAPLRFWPDPLGISGHVERTGPGFTSFSAMSNGVPAMTAVYPLELPIELNNELTFMATLRFPGGLTLDNNTFVQMSLHTFMSKPLR